jgi:hypothetical protein
MKASASKHTPIKKSRQAVDTITPPGCPPRFANSDFRWADKISNA